jgi:hypothetical protein
VARVLIVGGGCRGRRLAHGLVAGGHVARVTTRTQQRRSVIEATGAECWVGTPDRLATMRGALEGVSILCWLLGGASGSPRELRELHTDRLRFFLTQAIDTTVRGVLYEARGIGACGPAALEGEGVAKEVLARNSIPAEFLRHDPRDEDAWLEQARSCIDSLLMRGR